MRRYWFIALLLHAGLFTLLLVKFDWWKTETPLVPAAIQAVVVSDPNLPQAQSKDDEAQIRREQQRIEKERRKQEQDLKLKQQQEVEKKRREQLERKRVAQEQKHKEEEQLKRDKAKRIELEKEKRRKAEEQHRKAEEEAERKKAEQEKRKQEEVKRKKAEARKRRKEAERKLREDELKSQLAAEEEFLEGETRRKNQSLVEHHIKQITDVVANRWLEPPNASPGMSCILRIRLSPAGDVLRVDTVTSSGDTVFDRSVETAVRKASPLPLPHEPEILRDFVPELRFKFGKDD